MALRREAHRDGQDCRPLRRAGTPRRPGLDPKLARQSPRGLLTVIPTSALVAVASAATTAPMPTAARYAPPAAATYSTGAPHSSVPSPLPSAVRRQRKTWQRQGYVDAPYMYA